MNKNYFVSGLITLILITAAAAGAQDSSSTLGTVLDRINFDLGFGAYYMSASCDHISSNKVKLPDYLVGKSDSGYATDNPEYHGTSYFELKTVTDLSRDLTLYASLMAEHRGYSYGVYDSRRMDVYPIFNLKYRSYPDSNSLLPLATGVNIGNFQAYRRFEGLQIYNMDYQGALLFVQYKKLRLSHLHIADLLVGLRLNIGDYLDYMISLEGWNIFKGYSMDMRLGLIEYAGTQADDDIDAVNFSIGLYKDENFRAYGELGYRWQRPDRLSR